MRAKSNAPVTRARSGRYASRCEDVVDRVDEPVHRPALEEAPRPGHLHGHARARDVARDHRRAAQHRLDLHQPEALGLRRQRQHVARGIHVRERLRVVDEPEEADCVLRGSHSRLQLRPRVLVAQALLAREHDTQVLVPGTERRDRVEQQVGSLLLREPAREDDQRPAFRRELASQDRHGDRVRRRNRDRRRDDHDPVAPRREPPAVRRIIVRVRDERVGTPRREPPPRARHALDEAVHCAVGQVQVAMVRRDEPGAGAPGDRGPHPELRHRRVRPHDVRVVREPPRRERVSGHQGAAAQAQRGVEAQDVDTGHDLPPGEIPAVPGGQHGDAVAARDERFGDTLHVQRVAGPVRQVVLECGDDRQRPHGVASARGSRTIDVRPSRQTTSPSDSTPATSTGPWRCRSYRPTTTYRGRARTRSALAVAPCGSR